MEDNETQSENTSSIKPESTRSLFVFSYNLTDSSCDSILDTFMEFGDTLVEIRIEKMKHSQYLYKLRYKLNDRIDARKLKGISTFILNNQLFLEKE